MPAGITMMMPPWWTEEPPSMPHMMLHLSHKSWGDYKPPFFFEPWDILFLFHLVSRLVLVLLQQYLRNGSCRFCCAVMPLDYRTSSLDTTMMGREPIIDAGNRKTINTENTPKNLTHTIKGHIIPHTCTKARPSRVSNLLKNLKGVRSSPVRSVRLSVPIEFPRKFISVNPHNCTYEFPHKCISVNPCSCTYEFPCKGISINPRKCFLF